MEPSFYISLVFCLLSLFGWGMFIFDELEYGKKKRLGEREPQYYIIKHQGKWFPVKLTSKDGYYFVKDLRSGRTRWEFVRHYSTSIQFYHPSLHAYNSRPKAKRVIEKLEGTEIIELDGPDIFAERGRNVGFEKIDRDIGDLEDYESLGDYMYARFKNHDLSKIKIGSEQTSTNLFKNSRKKRLQKMFGSNS